MVKYYHMATLGFLASTKTGPVNVLGLLRLSSLQLPDCRGRSCLEGQDEVNIGL